MAAFTQSQIRVFALLMAAIVNTNLAGATVTYNGVQFGGADATYKMTPPMYALRGVHRYDDSGRAIIGVDYTLTIRCIVYEDSETLMANAMNAIRQKLAVPGALLTIRGMGTGFGAISHPLAVPAGSYADFGNGPKPGPFECVPLGQAAFELSWSVQFFVSECAASSVDSLAFLAFNFNTTWQNDFEGLCQRTISGHVLIPMWRDPATPKVVLHVAEETRGNIIVAVPPNFQRTANIWRESDDKQRLDFTIVDEQIEGDFLPAGITAADGSFGFSAGDGKGGFAEATATLSMSLKTAPNQPKNLAGQLFLAAALSKQGEIEAANTGGTVIPLKISIVNGKFGRARQTECSIVWGMTKCLSTMLAAAGIWSPVGDNDYTAWKASMANLWGNRGFAGLESSASEAVIIDLCDNVVTKTIGTVGSSPNNPADESLPSLTCPTISATGGWLIFDIDLRVLRQDEQTQHKKAVSYVPSVGSVIGQDPADAEAVTLGGPSYSQSASDQHVVEHQGYPKTLVALSFKGLRFKNKPFMPEIKTIGGMNVTLHSQDVGAPKWAFDSFGCPVWYLTGWRIYRVPGYVATVKAKGATTSCGASVADPTADTFTVR